MAEPRPTSPGWYRDPGDPARLRHWNGRNWDHRRRAIPPWSVATDVLVATPPHRRHTDPPLDGPVHPAALPATATAAASSQSTRRRPPVVAARPGGGQARRPSGQGAPSAWAYGTRPPGPTYWLRPRTVFMTLSTLIGLGVLVLAATVGVARAPVPQTQLALDTAFVAAANSACTGAINAARLTPTPTISAAGTIEASTSPTVAEVGRANARLNALQTRLLALPVTAADRSVVQGWLDDWGRFAADRMLVARAAARPSAATASAGTELVAAPRLDAATADAFALSNRLEACTLGQQGPGTLTKF